MPNSGWGQLVYANRQAHTELNTFTGEASLIQAAANFDQPVFPAGTFVSHRAVGKSFLINACGYINSTSTPTFQWQFRLGTTTGSAYLSGTSIGITAAATTGSGVTYQRWEAVMRITCYIGGIGTGLATLNCDGEVRCPGLASPFIYPLEPTAPPMTPPWTAVIDGALPYYLNLSAVCGTSNSANKIGCTRLWMWDLN